jgi:hypothetical protein
MNIFFMYRIVNKYVFHVCSPYLDLVSGGPALAGSRLLLLLQLDLQPADGGLVLLDPLTEQTGALLGGLGQLVGGSDAFLNLQL